MPLVYVQICWFVTHEYSQPLLDDHSQVTALDIRANDRLFIPATRLNYVQKNAQTTS